MRWNKKVNHPQLQIRNLQRNNWINMIIKKILSLLSILILLVNISFWEDIWVYAVVWEVNQAPRIVYVNPSNDPILLARGSLQFFVFGIDDVESDTVYYSLSADNWYLNPTNWSVAWTGDINFLYLAPGNYTGFTKIYITLNDTVNFVIKEINIYVY